MYGNPGGLSISALNGDEWLSGCEYTQDRSMETFLLSAAVFRCTLAVLSEERRSRFCAVTELHHLRGRWRLYSMGWQH